MKNKILCVCLGVALIIIAVLIIYIIQVKPECEKVHIDEIKETKVTKYIDEDFAKKIADVVMGTEDWEAQEKLLYGVEITFDKKSYEWVIDYIPKVGSNDGITEVRIRKDNGIVNIYYGIKD